MTLRRGLRFATLLAIGLLPNPIKKPLYRLLFGYRFAAKTRVGFAILDAQEVVMEEGSQIGHFNLVTRVGSLRLGPHAIVGNLNILRGGERIELAGYATVLRLNVLNAIPDHDCTTTPASVLEIGAGTMVVSGHRIDFTDRVTLGRNVIVAGRNSSFWTHNRQRTEPITIGDFCYLGSEIRVAPGATLAPECILALGSVLAGHIAEPRSLAGGVPARVVRPLRDEDLSLIHRKTRDDIPDGYYTS